MAEYTKPSLDAVNFALAGYSKPDISPYVSVASSYNIPSQNGVNFAIVTYSLPVFNKVNFETGSGVTSITGTASLTNVSDALAALGVLPISCSGLLSNGSFVLLSNGTILIYGSDSWTGENATPSATGIAPISGSADLLNSPDSLYARSISAIAENQPGGRRHTPGRRHIPLFNPRAITPQMLEEVEEWVVL